MIFSGRRRFQGDVRVDVRYRIGRRLTWPITARPQSPTRDLSASAMALTLTPAREKGVGRGADCSDILSQKGSRAGRRPRSGGKTGTDLEISSEGAGVAAAHGGLWVIARLRFTGWKGVFGRTSRVSRTGTDDGLGSLRGGALESAEGVTGDGWHSGERADCGHGDCAWRGFLSLRGSLWCA